MVIGRGQLVNVAAGCYECGVLIADSDVIWVEQQSYCSDECAPAVGYDRAEDADEYEEAS